MTFAPGHVSGGIYNGDRDTTVRSLIESRESRLTNNQWSGPPAVLYDHLALRCSDVVSSALQDPASIRAEELRTNIAMARPQTRSELLDRNKPMRAASNQWGHRSAMEQGTRKPFAQEI